MTITLCASLAHYKNEEKNGIKNYIGGNTLMEMGFAFVLGKKIYLLNPIPKISYKEEILAVKPIVLNGITSLQRDLDELRQHLPF